MSNHYRLRRMPLGVRDVSEDEQRRTDAALVAGARLMESGALSSICAVDTRCEHGPFLMDADADEPIPARLDSGYQSRSVLSLDTGLVHGPQTALEAAPLAGIHAIDERAARLAFANRVVLSGLRRIPGSLRHA